MPAHPIDFQIQSGFYSTPELTDIFDEKTRIRRWLQVEAALAQAQGELGIIPKQAAEEIAQKSRLEHLDLAKVAREYEQSRNSLMPVLKVLRQVCGQEHSDFIHFGITTQDVLDTAQILEQKDALVVIYRDLRKLEELLCRLAHHHRHTPMIGRTHGKQALPITFGLKICIWAAEIRRHIERLISLGPRLFTIQLSGAVGTMAALGPQARRVASLTAEKLGLYSAVPNWHTSRDTIAEGAAIYGLICATLEKIGSEIVQLSKTELGEVAETIPNQAQSSSTMPHKKNPVISQRVAVLSRHARALVSVVMDSMVHEHERDARALWSEWLATPQISIYTGTALHFLISVVENLEVRPERMLENLYRQKELVISEWLMFKLAEKTGKTRAQEKVQALIRLSEAGKRFLKDILLEDPDIGPFIAEENLEYLDKPERYCGLAAEIVDDTLKDIEAKRHNDPEKI
jgi:adenylosuccinate lyase/3-carboxy-cis,cis-muconate cycloisomerase